MELYQQYEHTFLAARACTLPSSSEIDMRLTRDAANATDKRHCRCHCTKGVLDTRRTNATCSIGTQADAHVPLKVRALEPSV